MKEYAIDDEFYSDFNLAFDLEMSRNNEEQIIDVRLHKDDFNRAMNMNLTNLQIEILNSIPIRLNGSYLKPIKEK